MFDTGLFRGIKTSQDFAREEQEFEMRKRQRAMQEQMGNLQLEQLQREMSAPKLPFEGTSWDAQIANEAYRFNLGKGFSEDEARQRAIDMVQSGRMDYRPVTDPYSGQVTMQPMPRQSIFGTAAAQPAMSAPAPDYSRTPDFMPPEFQVSAMPPPNVPRTGYTDVMQGDQLAPIPQGYSVPSVNEAFAPMDQQTAQQIQELFPTPSAQEMLDQGPLYTPMRQDVAMPVDPRAVAAPPVQMDIARQVGKANVDLQKGFIEGEADLQRSMRLKNHEDALRKADELLKTEEGRNRVAGIISRMQQINDNLKAKGAIVSADQPMLTRLGTALETTGVGQAQRKVTDPDAQALAEEYAKLQATLLPFFAKASGLGAKSLDSEGERKSIMGSFGDPAGIYEANRRQLQNLEQVFGVTTAPQAPAKPQGQRLRYNPATGRLE